MKKTPSQHTCWMEIERKTNKKKKMKMRWEKHGKIAKKNIEEKHSILLNAQI